MLFKTSGLKYYSTDPADPLIWKICQVYHGSKCQITLQIGSRIDICGSFTCRCRHHGFQIMTVWLPFNVMPSHMLATLTCAHKPHGCPLLFVNKAAQLCSQWKPVYSLFHMQLGQRSTGQGMALSNQVGSPYWGQVTDLHICLTGQSHQIFQNCPIQFNVQQQTGHHYLLLSCHD